MKEQKFKSLIGIRAVAAVMVFLYHNPKHWKNYLPTFFGKLSMSFM
jgi:peptidoglycan/LPS O-acetylase OafA/YrhL